jgi:F-box/TPR repeat protein Pof3
MKKPERAAKMVDYALERVKPNDAARRETLLALKQEVIDFAAAIKRHISRTSYHFGNIPVEISHEIFSLLVGSDHSLVLTVAGVCNTWRSVVLDNPSFWSTLVLTKKRPAKKAKLWIQRSGGRILHLKFVQGCLSDPRLNHSFQALLWESLRTLDTDVDIKEIVAPVGSKISRLDQLRITDSASARVLLNLLHKVRTRNLDIIGEHIQFHQIRQILSDCRTLSFHASAQFDVSDITHTISENKNLTALSISIAGHRSMDVTPSQLAEATLELPNLQQLDLRTNHWLLTLLCHATMPSLVSLSLSELTSIGDQLTTFLVRHPTTLLTDLTISRCIAPHPQLTSLLRASPHLRTVTIEGIPDINEVVEFLAATQPDAVQDLPCPSLEKLDLSSCASLRSGPIVRLVKERATNEDVVAIDTLVVDFCPLIEPEVRDWLSHNVSSFSCVYMRKKGTRWKR